MARTIKIRIGGSGPGDDAPSVDDFLDQIRDYVEILRSVEVSLSNDGQSEIKWRVVGASRNSPLEHVLQGEPRVYATNIDLRLSTVLSSTANGLSGIQETPERPPFFSDDTLEMARRIFKRVRNGLALSEVDFGDGIPSVRVTPGTAKSGETNVQQVLTPADKPYRELGSAEGYCVGAEKDGYGRRLLFIRQRLTGNIVKCVLSGSALQKFAGHQIDDVYRDMRVLVSGILHYRVAGRIRDIEASDIYIFPPKHELPTLDDILDKRFTGGLRSEEHLERVRNGTA